MDFLTEFDFIKGENIDLKIKEKAPAQNNYLPSYAWTILSKDEIVGGINLRIGYNENIYYGGNIGTEILEKYRGNGFAKKAARMVLPVAKKHGITELYISCNPNNMASRKIMESLPNCYFIEKAILPTYNDAYLKGEREKLIYKIKI